MENIKIDGLAHVGVFVSNLQASGLDQEHLELNEAL
jgi:hypothetical protein